MVRGGEGRKSGGAADGSWALGLSLTSVSGRDGNSDYCCCNGSLFSPMIALSPDTNVSPGHSSNEHSFPGL